MKESCSVTGVYPSVRSERSHAKGKWNFGITLQFICYCEEKAFLIFLPLPLAFSRLDLLAKAASESWERPSAVFQLNRQDMLITYKVILLCKYFLVCVFPGCWCFESSKGPLGEVSNLNVTFPEESLDKMWISSMICLRKWEGDVRPAPRASHSPSGTVLITFPCRSLLAGAWALCRLRQQMTF